MRARYIGTSDRFAKAFMAVYRAGPPLDPGDGPEPTQWTRQHVTDLLELQTALADMLDARKTWDGLRREHQTR